MTTEQIAIDKIIENSMMEFSAYTLLQRAIPDLRDGFKPVYRRILFSMYKMGATRLIKSATVSGECMKIHPHGSSYGTMVGMAQKDRHVNPLITGKGNFGNYTSRDLEPAAERYTESKLSDISISLMKDLNKDVVDFVDNYDGTIKIPQVLPVHFPTILAYAQSGIGVGFSSSIASYNLIELCDALIQYLKGKEIPILIPDFATKGYILNEPEAFEKINKTGIGTVTLRGHAVIDKNEITITEIPYTTTREAIIEKIIALAKTEKLKEITNINDLTGLKGLEISITARKGTDMELLLNKLYALTPLQDSHSSNMNVLADGVPKVLGVQEIIVEWTKWRLNTVKRGLSNELAQMKEKLHLLQGLEKVLLDIDKTIEIIRFSPDDKIESSLMEYFSIDKTQAAYISDMKLRNINKDYIINRLKATEKFRKDIKRFEKIIQDEKELKKIMIGQLEEVKSKFGVERQTKIISVSTEKIREVVRTVVEAAENYPVKIILTKDGYVYKYKNSANLFLKPGDKIVNEFETENDSELLIFTKDILCYKYPVSKIEETKPNQLGTYIPQLIKEPKIEIVNYSVLDSKNKFIIMAYSNNKISKVNMAAFEGNRKVLKKAYNLTQGLVDMITLSEDTKIEVKTSKTKIQINTSDLALAGNRLATGVYVTRKGNLESIKISK